MTQPPDPNATPQQTAAAFAERMKYVASQDFGGLFRPGLVASLAQGNASPDDLTRITNFVKALDLAKVAKANDAAGITSETSPGDSDLLMTIGEDKSIVQRANSSVSGSKDPNAQAGFLNNTLQTIAQYSANSGEVIFPQPDSFAPGHKAPDGSSNESWAQEAWHSVLTGLSWLGRVPGFIYQAGRLGNAFGLASGPVADPTLVSSLASGMAANGTYGNNFGGVTSYLWSHGESDFTDLGPVYSAHGKDLTNTAIAMFQADKGYGSAASTWTGNVNFQNALANYQGFLNAQLQAGKITPKQFAQATEKLSSPDLEAAYRDVDSHHVSAGRDLARNIGLDPSSGAGHYVSGLGDFAWDMFADPTIVGGKAKAGLTAIRYGLDSLGDTSKLSRLYGVADKVTGEVPKLNPVLNAGAFQAQKRLTTFLAYNKAILTAEKNGDRAMAASLYAENAARHPDFMPAYMEAQGWRAAETPEEIAQAKKDGTSLSLGGDAVHEAMAPSRGGKTPEEIAKSVQAFKDASIPAVLKAKPIETPEEWVDWLGNQGGLYRWAAGLSVRQARVLPGKMGFAAEARASIMGRMAFNRVLAGSGTNPLLNGAIHLGEIDIDKEAGKIIPSDEGEAYKTADAARRSGQEIGGRDSASWLRFAQGLKAKAATTGRALTTWLPTNHIIALNGVQASKDFERFVRTFMGRDVASTARYMWDNAESESARRQLGRAIVNQVADASGITRSPAGRAWMEQWNAAFDEVEHARYGRADTDLIPDVFRGNRRVAMNLSQLETHLVLPAFTDMRRAAAKAAILGFDKPLDQIGGKVAMKSWFTTAQGDKAVWGGIKRMLASPTATVRYGLFNNQLLTRVFGLMKLGWLGTTSNMIRQFAEEYTGLRLTRHGADLAEGKRLARSMGTTFALTQKLHHMIPHFLRATVSDEGGLHNAVTHGRLAFSWGERPLTDIEREIRDDLTDMVTEPQALELLGGRQTTQAEGGVADAIDAHNSGVQMQRVGWKRGQLVGYKEAPLADLNGDTGRRALAAEYVNLFIDKDEPARRVLAYLMWNHAAKDSKFLAELDPDTLKMMHELVPASRDASTSTFAKMTQDAPTYTERGADGAQTAETHVTETKTGTLRLLRHTFGANSGVEEAPVKYIYRVVDKADYERMKAAGVVNSDYRAAHADAMYGDVTYDRIAKTYGQKDDGAVLLKIKYRKKDGWKRDTTHAANTRGTVSTTQDIPWSQVHSAAPFTATWNEGTKIIDLAGTDGKLLGASKQAIRDYVKNGEGAAPFRARGEWLNRDEAGRALAADDEAGRDAAIARYVESHIYNVSQVVHAADGKSMDAGLVSSLLRGKTPSELELAKIPAKQLPENVIAAEFAPVADGPLDKLGEKITQAAAMGGKAFDHIVTNPMQRLERKPLFYGNYARAYKELQRYRDIMVGQGFSEENAKAITRRMALGRGLQETIKYIDNPKVASQFSAIAQNFYLFYRAQEDFIRRWAGIVKERPETLRLAQMAINGAVQSGMAYRDSDESLQIAYPGSGAVIDAFLMAQRGLGIADEHGVKVPSAHDLTTQLNYLNPSLMNPAGFSATPMVTIPWDLIKLAIPGHDMLKSQVDYAFTGQLGNGRAWYEQFLPTEVNRILQLSGDGNDTHSLVGGAAATTVMHASLAGQLDDGADDVQRQHKIADLKTMTLGALWARALFAFAAPGATSVPELDYKDKSGKFIGDPQADVSWHAMGVKNMHDEFLAMIQAFGTDKAMVVWQELHPNLLPYTTGKTTVGAASANADPTHPATQWILGNKQLFDGPYSRVAAYFIPSAPGTFDQVGWNAMTELDVRQYKTLEQYYIDIASKNAVTAWYNAKDKYEPEIAKQKAAGQRVVELQAEYDKVKTNLKAEYPILTSYFADHSTRQAERTQMVSELRTMAKDPSVSNEQVPDLPGVAQMLTVLDNYNQQMAYLKGQRSTWATSQRQDLNTTYEDTMAGITKKFPGLTDLYNGVFREMEQ